jgi:DNA-binding XRE family transcriptional regulator
MASEAAEILGVVPGTIRNRINNGTLDGRCRTLPSGERRYEVRKSAVEKYQKWSGASRLPWGDQGLGVEELASRLDIIAERQDVIAERQDVIAERQEDIDIRKKNIEKLQENIDKRLESVEDAVREVLATLQQQEQAAERERDELRELLTHAAYQAAPPPMDTSIEDTNVEVTPPLDAPAEENKVQKDDRTESPKVNKKGVMRRINARKVQLLRDKALMTQGDLAEEAGLNPVTVSRIESGHIPSPRRDTFFALAKVFGIDPLELVIRD